VLVELLSPTPGVTSGCKPRSTRENALDVYLHELMADPRAVPTGSIVAINFLERR
jgi:hypothetical protein